MTPKSRAAGDDIEMITPTAGARRPGRFVIEHVSPVVDGGRFPLKRTLGQPVVVEADIFVDGHDRIRAVVRWRPVGAKSWESSEMTALGNDRFGASFTPEGIGRHEFEVRAVIDEYRTWLSGFEARRDAGQDTTSERAVGFALLSEAAARTRGAQRTALTDAAKQVANTDAPDRGGPAPADLHELGRSVDLTVPQGSWVVSARMPVAVERERAQHSSWYELFPRATGSGGIPGTFADVERRLGYVSELGFDVLYLPPIHPIGATARKGARGAPGTAADPGSPWAIGSSDGGHTAVAPELGTIGEFDHLVEEAAVHGLEIALDFALQCSPDHPWVTEHPGWFRHRPDGSIACAENPPKRYEDVYPLDFECDEWRALWKACLGIVEFWIAHGVKIFRVDNPHTKPFLFWEWMIAEVQGEHPEVIFLAEAFTRPRVMEHLAKLGFSQSYTYFTWRREAWELEEYFSELANPPMSEYFRPNAWPNTPDILVAPLAGGTRPAFALRAVLAATLSANWGIYGPVFEMCESVSRDDAEEYARSDKFEIREYPFDPGAGVAPLVARLNAIRRVERAFANITTLRFHHSDNPALVVYSKTPEDGDVGGGAVLVIVNLDPGYRQTGWVEIDPEPLGFGRGSTLELADQLSGERFRWTPGRNFVALDPQKTPAHLFTVRWAVG